jgi:hypothetical protein
LEDIDFIFSRGGNPVKTAKKMMKELQLHGHIAQTESEGNSEKVSHQEVEVAGEKV